jgi:glycosyltransferase involved in cell wall biosynthesis
MKLLIIFPSTIRGGAEEYALTIGHAAIQHGWTVEAAFPETDGTRSLRTDFAERQIVCHTFNICEHSEYHAETLLRHTIRLCKTGLLLRRIQPDVVLLNLPWPIWGVGSLLACGIWQVPAIVVFHGASHPFAIGPRRLKAYHWAKSQQQQWITVSDYVRTMLCQAFHLPESAILRIYNGVDSPHYEAARTSAERLVVRAKIRRELGVSLDSQIVLTVGRLHEAKGYADIIPVVPHLCKEYLDLRFVWAGEGEYRPVLEQKIREYNIEQQILLLGQRSDVPDVLQAADLFLFPSHFEGMPFALLEAMRCGVPIIASHAASIPEVITSGEHGLLFRVGDSCDLLETLRWALMHPHEMRAMAQNALSRVKEFSQEAMISQMLAVLRDIAKIPPRQGV